MSLPFISALDLAAAIRSKQISPLEVARLHLAAIDRLNPKINAVIWRRDEQYLAEARAAEALVMSGAALPPFHGVPLPIKDLTEVFDHRVTHGSRAASQKIGRYDTSSIARLRAAGFLFSCRTNSPEFGTLPVTENALYGATRNPWNLAHSPGGSSGGAAAAVAAGIAPVAHASDGGGSIRIPASACGLVGLKPSRVRIAKGPLVSDVMNGFTTDGVVAKTVADTAALLDVMAHHDPTAWYSLPLPAQSYLSSTRQLAPRLRIGISTEGPYGVSGLPLAQSSIDAVTKTATILSELGHFVEPVTVDWPYTGEALAQDFLAVWCTSCAYQDIQDWSLAEAHNRSLQRMATLQSSTDYIRAVLRLQVFSRKILRDWGKDYDLLLMPSLAIEPPPLGWLFRPAEAREAAHADDPLLALRRSTEMVPFSGWCNVTGQPAISLPTHIAASGLPVGVQLAAGPQREDLLLMIAAELEAAMHWQHQSPPLFA